MYTIDECGNVYSGLPPCGGSGLKLRYASGLSAEVLGLPPCGGSGLK